MIETYRIGYYIRKSWAKREHDQEMPQSHTTDQPTALLGKGKER